MAKTKVVKKVKAVKSAKKYIVQFECDGEWVRSETYNGVYKTLAAAKKVAAKQQEKSAQQLKYRVVAA